MTISPGCFCCMVLAMNDEERKTSDAAASLASRFWECLQYSGQGLRYYRFNKALKEAVEAGRMLERNRILDAINPESSGEAEAIHESKVQ